MTKELAIIFSDAHVHLYKQFNQDDRRLTNGIALIDYIFRLAHNNGINLILFPGDLYDQMNVVSTKAGVAILSCFDRNFRAYPEIHFVAISGNHDQATKNLLNSPAESALMHLTMFPQFHLLDADRYYETAGGNLICGIPYFEFSEHFKTVLEETTNGIAQEGLTFLMMHQVVASGLPIEDCIEPDHILFDKFSMIFNGHLHKAEEVTEKFINIGSPMHRDAGDIGIAKGIWLVDLCDPYSTLTFKDITNKFPQFIHKPEGAELTEWESQQYVIRVPESLPMSEADVKVVENFTSDLSPAVIITNYCAAVISKEAERKAKLEYGLSLLQ